MPMQIEQITFSLRPYPRGFHLITPAILKEVKGLRKFKTGILHLFILHTSASLCINENADPSVRADFETSFNRMVPENPMLYTHQDEGSDDMPAHIKAALLQTSLSIPVRNGALLMGTWQGIYLCEHRDHGGRREFAATIWGDLLLE